jgi:DNA/RNA-binding domain of Phe-tRNA-synthetase-like protein
MKKEHVEKLIEFDKLEELKEGEMIKGYAKAFLIAEEKKQRLRPSLNPP